MISLNSCTRDKSVCCLSSVCVSVMINARNQDRGRNHTHTQTRITSASFSFAFSCFVIDDDQKKKEKKKERKRKVLTKKNRVDTSTISLRTIIYIKMYTNPMLNKIKLNGTQTHLKRKKETKPNHKYPNPCIIYSYYYLRCVQTCSELEWLKGKSGRINVVQYSKEKRAE